MVGSDSQGGLRLGDLQDIFTINQMTFLKTSE